MMNTITMKLTKLRAEWLCVHLVVLTGERLEILNEEGKTVRIICADDEGNVVDFEEDK